MRGSEIEGFQLGEIAPDRREPAAGETKPSKYPCFLKVECFGHLQRATVVFFSSSTDTPKMHDAAWPYVTIACFDNASHFLLVGFSSRGP
jgi:hypothetical protein